MKFLLAIIAATAAVKIQEQAPIRKLAQDALDKFDANGDGILSGVEASKAVNSIPGFSFA